MRKTTPSLLLGAAAAAALLAAAPTIAAAQPGPGAAPGGAPGAGPGPGRGAGRGGMAIFEQADVDRDGRVVWEEAWAYVQRRFNEADRDRDGGLTQDELQGALRLGAGPRGNRAAGAPADGQPPAAGGGDAAAGGRGPRSAEMMGAVFRGLDADRNGRVTLQEIRPMAEARFRAFDANADNAVSRDEVPQGERRRGPGGGGPRGQAPATPG